MKIEFLKDNPGLLKRIAGYMFDEWGNSRPGITIDRYLNYLSENLNKDKIPCTIIAKTDNDELLGFASLVTFDMDINKDLTPWISGVFIVPRHRRKGIGRLLVTRLEQLAREFGIEKLYLYTEVEKFYAGFSWVKIRNEFYSNSTVTIMKKDLTQPDSG